MGCNLCDLWGNRREHDGPYKGPHWHWLTAGGMTSLSLLLLLSSLPFLTGYRSELTGSANLDRLAFSPGSISSPAIQLDSS